MTDPLSVFDELQPVIEMLRGVIAAFIAEGFTDEQARALAVYIATNGKP